MLSVDQVNDKLVSIGYQNPFTVVFQKMNGDKRELTCFMEKPESEPQNIFMVPVKDLDTGQWKSFKVDRVISLDPLYQ